MSCADNIEIIVLNPKEAAHREAFLALNLAWISRYFQVEPHDEEQLRDPDTHILAEGGEVLLAVAGDGEIVGTCAVIASGPGEFELAKMSVAEHFRRGVGNKLCETAVTRARGNGARRLWLESNRQLTPALRLYEKAGFRETPLVPSPYTRADIRMELTFESPSPPKIETTVKPEEDTL
jgi:ribosomal protein S18 acetylase RimI-like enzyme